MKGKIIDNYWNSVLSNSPLVDLVNEQDEKALQNLLDIQIVWAEKDIENHQNISLKFIFKPNAYFNETVLTRNLITSNGEFICVEGTKITWKENKCLTHEKKKITNKATGENKFVQGKKIQSFFDIFLDWNVQTPEELERAAFILGELGNLIVKDSISYFLGLINADDLSDEED